MLASLLRGTIESSNDVITQIPDIHESISGSYLFGKKTSIFKTHWKYWTEIPLREDTIGIIYILRNPIDVLESNGNFSLLRSGSLRTQIDSAAFIQVANAWVDEFIKHGGHQRFRHFGMGSLEENIRSWTWPDLSIPRVVLRYEDIKAEPGECLERLCKFLGLKRSAAQIAAVVAACGASAMRAMEDREIANRTEGFFYQKRNASGLDASQRFVGRNLDHARAFRLTPEQRERAAMRFSALMREYGYEA